MHLVARLCVWGLSQLNSRLRTLPLLSTDAVVKLVHGGFPPWTQQDEFTVLTNAVIKLVQGSPDELKTDDFTSQLPTDAIIKLVHGVFSILTQHLQLNGILSNDSSWTQD